MDKENDNSHSNDIAQNIAQENNNVTQPDKIVSSQSPGLFNNNPELNPSPQHKGKLGKKKLAIILGSLTTIILIGLGVFYFLNKPKEQIKNDIPGPQPVAEQKKETPPAPPKKDALAKFINPTTGETWFSTPVRLANQNYYKPEARENTEYYQVGKRKDNVIIMSVTSVMGDQIDLFEKSPDGMVTIIARPDSQMVYNEDDENWSKDSLVKTVKIDKSIHYDSISPPKNLDIGKGYEINKSTYFSLGDLIRPQVEISKETETIVKHLGQSTIVKRQYKDPDTGLVSIGYALKTPLNTIVKWDYEPTELSLDKYQWSKGHPTGSKMKPIARGCGGLSYSVTQITTLKDSDVSQFGVSPSEQKVYVLKDPNHILIKKAYEELKEFNSGVPDAPWADITKKEFVEQNPIILYKDKFGQWLVYILEDLSPAAGCAKPVVYLYPENVSRVNVKVGADVKVSVPKYPADEGWNVLAFPGGKIITQMGLFDSLFWEGPGNGVYPNVSSGIIVKQKDAIPTIKDQLVEQGLNQKEINDFVEYWSDKLPDKPYIRLTWFDTQQLNKLAPLDITPRPDTVIRVFLDAGGMDKPVDITSQKLSKLPREGFTVVEWGGLSHKKLY